MAEGFSYNINSNKKDSRAKGFLNACHAIYNVEELIVSTFLVAYIYSLTNGIFEYIKNVGTYYILTFAFMLVTNLLFSKIVDQTNRVSIYRLGIILRVALVLLSVFCGRNLAMMLPLAGFLNGLSCGCYYAAYNVIKQEMVERNKMKRYATLQILISEFVKIAMPISLGLLIDISTYAQVSIYVLILGLIQSGLSFGIKSKKPLNSSFSLKQYFSTLKTKPEAYKKIKLIYIACFLSGFTSIAGVLLNMCIMLELGNNFSLGALTSVFAILSMAVLLLTNKFTKPGKRKALFTVVAITSICLTISFAVCPNVVTLILHNLGICIVSIWFNSDLEIYRNKTLKEAEMYDFIAEHQSMCELTMNISRVVSFGLLLLIGLTMQLWLFYVALVVFSSFYAITLFVMLRYEHKFERTNENIEQSKANNCDKQ